MIYHIILYLYPIISFIYSHVRKYEWLVIKFNKFVNIFIYIIIYYIIYIDVVWNKNNSKYEMFNLQGMSFSELLYVFFLWNKLQTVKVYSISKLEIRPSYLVVFYYIYNTIIFILFIFSSYIIILYDEWSIMIINDINKPS